MLSGKIERFVHHFPSLQNIPMGDSAERELSVYLPPKDLWAGHSERTSVYFLPGWGSRHSKFLQDSSVFGSSFLEQIESAMRSSQLPPFIAVFVDASSRLGCSQYINSPSLGPIQDWIADDLTALIDQRYGSSPKAHKRIIAGQSSGGFGALWMGFQRPDRFARVISAAGDSFFELSIMGQLLPTWMELQKTGGIDPFLESFFSHPQPTSQGSGSFLTMLTLSLAPCYSPRPDQSPLRGELFFDLETGEIIEDIWQEYLTHDPIRGLDRIDPKSLKESFFVLDCGSRDEFAAQLGHRQLAKKMKALAIPHHWEEFSGKHSGNDWRYVDRLKKCFELTPFK